MWCNKYIKVPFKDKGRDSSGVDCWGLARLIYKGELNIDLPLLLGYNDIKDCKKISNIYNNTIKQWQLIEKGQEQPFDIVVLDIYGAPTHVGVVIEKGLMIHCEKGSNTNIQDYLRSYKWLRNVRGFYRYVG